MIELKPCPFCGDKPVFEQEEIYCECGICMAQGSREKDSDFINRWNTRADMDKAIEQAKRETAEKCADAYLETVDRFSRMNYDVKYTVKQIKAVGGGS